MNSQLRQLDMLKDIKQIMERSSRFISLSGLSGIAAGVCALIGTWFANYVMIANYDFANAKIKISNTQSEEITINDIINSNLLRIAVLTFICAFVLALLFTYLRSKKNKTAIWGTTAKRLMINVSVPMLVGAIFLFKLIENGIYNLIVPGCLLFYGLAVLNASKYTLQETKYLAYSEIVTGIISLWIVNYALYFWAFGFGVLHIFYGILMWLKYERN
ncbi:MAG: hypothetical protein ACR2FN_04900 [Chitinophagaceae bacterium]